jgi:hypothetical protein
MRTLPAVIRQLRRYYRGNLGQASVVPLLLQRGADPTLKRLSISVDADRLVAGRAQPRRGLTREVAALLEGRG